MKYTPEEQRKLSFTSCCESLERLISNSYTALHMFERYSDAIGIIVIHQHYDPERVKKILAVVKDSAEKGDSK